LHRDTIRSAIGQCKMHAKREVIFFFPFFYYFFFKKKITIEYVEFMCDPTYPKEDVSLLLRQFSVQWHKF
jgi:hypothetical protein